MGSVPILNVFPNPPDALKEESFTELFQGNGYRVERICSQGQASPPDFWYDQDHTEWVMVLSGSARLQFAGEEERKLIPGDYILIRPHEKHRVNWTAPEELTVWLAIHEIPQGGTT
jgi:cupin 2 domain-containing protein